MSKIVDLRDALVTKALFSKKNNMSIPAINYRLSIGTYEEIDINGAKLIKIGDSPYLGFIKMDKVYTSAALSRKIGVSRQTIKNNSKDYFVIKLEDRDLYYMP